MIHYYVYIYFLDDFNSLYYRIKRLENENEALTEYLLELIVNKKIKAIPETSSHVTAVYYILEKI